ncbi:hypothetical protein PGTUg99_001046 [Puccinia graminis f. sp. tritici]|uniref:Uncharacterized protein n=1 Tax=Puccinia graminis f. sp. tritici TaxID=56615 RepID=A0A5B0RAT1_PUCGR|nr:hypothetical protein PGTUg99_001046 [Puccinia graminis f. sp. tritici]
MDKQDHSPSTLSRRSNHKSSSRTEARQTHQTLHPSFEIIRHKSFGTLMHELWIRFQGEFGLSMLETVSPRSALLQPAKPAHCDCFLS